MNVLTSTRQSAIRALPSEAMLAGIAPDGGLFVFEQFPKLPLDQLLDLPYADMVGTLLSLYLDEWSAKQLIELARRAYRNAFTSESCTQFKHFNKLHFCELYHGPTYAFKDFALTVLPHLLTASLAKQNTTNRLLILTATSGDTGKAALQGFADVTGIDIVVFYPANGVSPIQARQMQTQAGQNLAVFAIEGNFDDAQSHVKKMFNDQNFKEQTAALGVQLSSANSINMGRLLPQIAYYVDSYRQLFKAGAIKFADAINVVVPSGNFGNILAAYYAKQMGLPIANLICASNCNDVLTEFINTGVYNANRQFYTTMSPSMDILISSNLERLIYHLSGNDSCYTANLMLQLANKQQFEVNHKVRAGLADFYAYACNESGTQSAINEVYNDCDYLIDPHTAVAYHCYQCYQKETGDQRHAIIMSTASPFKFADSVCQSLAIADSLNNQSQKIALLATHTKLPIPPYFETLNQLPLLHNKTISIEQMPNSVLEFIRRKK